MIQTVDIQVTPDQRYQTQLHHELLAEKLNINPTQISQATLQRASLDGVAVHDITRTLDTFEALYRGEAIPE